MSIKSMIRGARTRADVKYLDTTTRDGGQLQRMWKIRHRRVPVRLNALSREEEKVIYDRHKKIAKFKCYLVTLNDILTTDRIMLNNRTFNIVLITDTDELGRLQTLYLEEKTND